MAKRSLGPTWRQRTSEERKEYVVLFRQVLENSYLGKVEAYQGEKIKYGKESVEEGRIATVETLIVTGKGQEIPLNYRMLKGRRDGASTMSPSRRSASSTITARSSPESSRNRRSRTCSRGCGK
jgi:ABC-type transporter MlaC component